MVNLKAARLLKISILTGFNSKWIQSRLMRLESHSGVLDGDGVRKIRYGNGNTQNALRSANEILEKHFGGVKRIEKPKTLDEVEIREVKQDIKEATDIITYGRRVSGKPYEPEALQSIRNHILKQKEKIGDTSPTPEPKIIKSKPKSAVISSSAVNFQRISLLTKREYIV